MRTVALPIDEKLEPEAIVDLEAIADVGLLALLVATAEVDATRESEAIAELAGEAAEVDEAIESSASDELGKILDTKLILLVGFCIKLQLGVFRPCGIATV